MSRTRRSIAATSRSRGGRSPIRSAPRGAPARRETGPPANRRERRATIALEAQHVIPLSRISDVDEVMRHTRTLVRGRLGRTDIHAAVDLARIGGDDLASDALGDAHGESALARRGGPDD